MSYKNREFGLAGIEETLESTCNKELKKISTGLRARVAKHGEQRDDQTILLVRRLA